MRTKQCDLLPAQPCYHVKTHGGLGDIVWVYKALHNLPLPIFLSISEENRARPRRSGILADHLPRVIGWRFDGLTFADGGKDWPIRGHASCAMDTTWADLRWQPNTITPYRLECNQWLEGGRRLENWLPDIKKTHHFEFTPTEESRLDLTKPYVIFHLAGWPDVPNAVWQRLIRLFYNVAHIYVVGGSYDHRAATVATNAKYKDVTLLEDLEWCDLYNLIKGCTYCFGHASGFTALADVLRCKGAIINPKCVSNLVGTWNSLENKDLLYVNTVTDFEEVVHAAAAGLVEKKATWPPTITNGIPIAAEDYNTITSALTTSGTLLTPRNLVIAAYGDHPDWLASAVMRGTYLRGCVVDSVSIINCNSDVAANVFIESGRCTKKPVVTQYNVMKEYKERGAVVDYVLIHSNDNMIYSFDAANILWQRLNQNGIIIMGGSNAKIIADSLASSLRIEAGRINNCKEDWYFIHKKM